MPSVSKAQQALFGAIHAAQNSGDYSKLSPYAKKMAKSMSKKDVADFAATKIKNLPNKVKKEECEEDYVNDIMDGFLKEIQDFGVKDNVIYKGYNIIMWPFRNESKNPEGSFGYKIANENERNPENNYIIATKGPAGNYKKALSEAKAWVDRKTLKENKNLIKESESVLSLQNSFYRITKESVDNFVKELQIAPDYKKNKIQYDEIILKIYRLFNSFDSKLRIIINPIIKKRLNAIGGNESNGEESPEKGPNI
jgi:DNA-directed RNA polymerase subunit F